MNTKAHGIGVLGAALGVSGFFLLSQRAQLSQDQYTGATEQIQLTQLPSPQARKEKRVYVATEIYTVPHDHQNAITLSVILDNNVISEVSLDHDVSSSRSKYHVDAFDIVYKERIIGMPLSQVDAVYVSGSTRTSDAFNRAIEKIQKQFYNT